MYQLGSYVKFFNILRDLEDENLIDNKQKQLLKINFTTKDQQLMEILSQLEGEDDEEVKFSLISYLKTLNQSKPTIQRQAKRSRSSITDIAIRGLQDDKNQVATDQKALKELENASNLIMNLFQRQKDGAQLDRESNKILDNLKSSLLNVQSPTRTPISYGRQNSIIADINYILEDGLLEVYKQVKSQFTNHMRSHLLLMDENVSYVNIFTLLKEMSKHLVNCDQFSFIIEQFDQVETYSTLNDQIETITLTQELKDEILSIPYQKMSRFKNDSIICSTLKLVNCSSFGLHFQNTLMIFHTKDDVDECDRFLKIVNEYQLVDEVRDLSQFLIQTIQNAKVQFFSPLSIADMILDIGISFVRCSKYLLIEEMFQLLSQAYKIDKLFSDSNDIQPYDPDYNFIVFKDFSMSVVFRFYSLNLNKQSDSRIFNDVKSYYEKYLRFIRECYDKNAFYKFFLRSNDSLIFEFDKSGHLIFLSRPIPPIIKENFNIRFNTNSIHNNQLSYTQVFDPLIIADIENYLEDEKWKVKQENLNQQYEIFLKIEEKTYKGFAVIFTENQKGWIKEQLKTLGSSQYNSKIQAKIRKQLIQHETINFVNKLEENNPEFKNSVASLYMPLNQKLIKRKIQSIPLIFKQQQQSDVVPRNRKTEMPARSKFASEFDLQEFQLDDQDEIVDSFEYNILEYSKQIQKHRTIWAILKRTGAMDNYQIPYDNCQAFIKEMEYHYNANQNPYHNYDHGVTVMQSAHYMILLLQKSKYSLLLDEFQRFVLMISSLCHDVGHTGKTNLYEINSLSDLAIRYHDKSVLEQHHAALTIQILKNPNCNILVNFNQEQFRNFRKGLISNIMATDMSEHFGLLKDFESRPTEFSDSKLLSGIIMHLCDFGGIVKKTNISRQWSGRVNQEFIVQNKLEEQYGYPQQPYMMDLDKEHIMAKSEIGFLKVIVRPSYVIMSQFLDNALQHCIQNIDESIQQWEKIARKIEEKQ